MNTNQGTTDLALQPGLEAFYRGFVAFASFWLMFANSGCSSPQNTEKTGTGFTPTPGLTEHTSLVGNRLFTSHGLWDVETGKELQTFPREPGFISAGAFSPDGLHFVTPMLLGVKRSFLEN